MIDEGVPRRVASLLRGMGEDVAPFPREWRGSTNGLLLALLRDSGFECLLTCDRNIPYQQTISASGISLVVLPAPRFEEVEPFASEIINALRAAKPGSVAIVSNDVGGR